MMINSQREILISRLFKILFIYIRSWKIETNYSASKNDVCRVTKINFVFVQCDQFMCLLIIHEILRFDFNDLLQSIEHVCFNYSQIIIINEMSKYHSCSKSN